MTTFISNKSWNIRLANIPDDFAPVEFIFPVYDFHAPNLEDSEIVKDYVEHMVQKLKSFDPEKDQIMAYGDQNTIACMSAIITGSTNGVLPILRYNKRAGKFERFLLKGL